MVKGQGYKLQKIDWKQIHYAQYLMQIQTLSMVDLKDHESNWFYHWFCSLSIFCKVCLPHHTNTLWTYIDIVLCLCKYKQTICRSFLKRERTLKVLIFNLYNCSKSRKIQYVDTYLNICVLSDVWTYFSTCCWKWKWKFIVFFSHWDQAFPFMALNMKQI